MTVARYRLIHTRAPRMHRTAIGRKNQADPWRHAAVHSGEIQVRQLDCPRGDSGWVQRDGGRHRGRRRCSRCPRVQVSRCASCGKSSHPYSGCAFVSFLAVCSSPAAASALCVFTTFEKGLSVCVCMLRGQSHVGCFCAYSWVCVKPVIGSRLGQRGSSKGHRFGCRTRSAIGRSTTT